MKDIYNRKSSREEEREINEQIETDAVDIPLRMTGALMLTEVAIDLMDDYQTGNENTLAKLRELEELASQDEHSERELLEVTADIGIDIWKIISSLLKTHIILISGQTQPVVTIVPG